MNQSTGHRLPSFFITDPMPCPYIEGMMERKLFTHIAGERADEINNNLTHAGFAAARPLPIVRLAINARPVVPCGSLSMISPRRAICGKSSIATAP